MKTFNVKPNVKGKVVQMVRDPETYRALATTGETKPRNSYWLRRIKDGDVVEVLTAVQKKETVDEQH